MIVHELRAAFRCIEADDVLAVGASGPAIAAVVAHRGHSADEVPDLAMAADLDAQVAAFRTRDDKARPGRRA